MDRVIAIGEDQYWLAAVKKIGNAWLSVETVQCHPSLTNCYEFLPEPENDALLLVDAASEMDINQFVSDLAQKGWTDIVVVAADPSAHESTRVLHDSGAVDYWDKTYHVADILKTVEKCLKDIHRRKTSPRPRRRAIPTVVKESESPIILLVDNNRDYTDSLAQYLEMNRFTVRKAYSRQEALDLLRIIRFELCIIDIHLRSEGDLHDESGLEVAKHAKDKGTPCIVITALPSVDLVRGALMNIEVDDFIQKKHGPEAVLQAIQRLQGLTILHLSDIHFQRVVGGEPFDQHKAYQEFLSDIRKQPGLLMNPISAIVVSGDISYRCEPDSFDMAEKFLKELARDLHVPRKHIILSLGNHDIDRQKASRLGDSLKEMQTDDLDWFNKFEPFLAFTRRFYGHPAFTPKKLYRAFNLDGRVSIVAFNSCIVEGDEEWRCRKCKKVHFPGWINREQVDQAGKELSRRGLSGLRIAVFHHHILPSALPSRMNACQGEDVINYFDPQQRLEYVFSENGFRILLHGHWHKIGLHSSNIVGSNVPLRFGSGAFWTTSSKQDESANYLLLQLSPRRSKSRILMRRYAPSTEQRPGFWGADDSIQPDGIITLPEDIIIPVQTESPVTTRGREK